jgi:hypothetical protein
VCVRKETVTKLFFHNSFRFNKIFRSLSLAILGGFFLAACNQEGSSTGGNQEAAASAPTYSAQSIAQARRDTQTEKAADRDLQRYQADLRLKEVQINAERESKNQFDGDAAKLEVEKVRQNGENYRADSSAAAQKTSALTSTLGTVVSAVGPAMINSSAEAKKAKLQIDDNKEARGDRRDENAAELGFRYRELEMKYNGGKNGKTFDETLREDLTNAQKLRAELVSFQEAKKKLEREQSELKKASTTSDRKTELQKSIGNTLEKFPGLEAYKTSLETDVSAAKKIGRELDTAVQQNLNAVEQDIKKAQNFFPPSQRPSTPTDPRAAITAITNKVYANNGHPVAAQPSQPAAGATAEKGKESNFLCDQGDTDCGGLKTDIDAMSADFFNMAKVDLVESTDRTEKLAVVEAKFGAFETHIQNAIKRSSDETFKNRATNTLEAFKGTLNQLKNNNAAAREALKDATTPADIYKIAQKKKWVSVSGTVSVGGGHSQTEILETATSLGSSAPVFAGVGSDFSPNAGSRENDRATIDLFDNQYSVPRATPI